MFFPICLRIWLDSSTQHVVLIQGLGSLSLSELYAPVYLHEIFSDVALPTVLSVLKDKLCHDLQNNVQQQHVEPANWYLFLVLYSETTASSTLVS